MATRFASALRLRLATLLLPPLGLIILWQSEDSVRRKVFGTLGIALYVIPYAALIIFLLVKFTGLKIEWRGGYAPAFTFHKTAPNYAAVEAHRAAQNGVAAVSHTTPPPPYWVGFRGPNRDGHYDEQPILTNWPAGGPHLLWRQPCGGGYASFAIAEGLVFTIEQRNDEEVVTACDLETGREVWAVGWKARFTEYYSDEGPRATPAYDDGKVYALGAEGEFRCLKAKTGDPVWAVNILHENHAGNATYGMSASPLIVDGNVIVQPGGTRGASIVAYDKKTGRRVWQSLVDEAAYSSPMEVELAGQRQLLAVTATRAVGLDIGSGQLLWGHPWTVPAGNHNIAQPVVLSSNRFLLAAGYTKGCEAIEINRSGTGFAARTVWRNRNLKNKFTSSVLWHGHLYGLDEDMLECVDAETGARKWKDGRYGYGQIILASGHVIVLGGDGLLALVEATPEQFHEVARAQAIHGKTWNHPALAHGRLLVRNAVEMACFDLTP